MIVKRYEPMTVPNVTSNNPVPLLLIWAGKLKQAVGNEIECRNQALGVAFESAAVAFQNSQARRHITAAWQVAAGTHPRIDTLPSMLRHTVALVLDPEHPKQAMKAARFYARAMAAFDRGMSAKAVAEALKKDGIRSPASETAKRRAALKVSNPAQRIGSPLSTQECVNEAGSFDSTEQLLLWPEGARSDPGEALNDGDRRDSEEVGAFESPVPKEPSAHRQACRAAGNLRKACHSL
jgi:hypothetical protein